MRMAIIGGVLAARYLAPRISREIGKMGVASGFGVHQGKVEPIRARE